MRRQLTLFISLVLYLSALTGATAARYGEWLLDEPRSSVFVLSFTQSEKIENQTKTSKLVFICDRRNGSQYLGVMLISLDETFKSQQNAVFIVIQKDSREYDPSDLVQKWRTGTTYFFLDAKDDIDELVSFLKVKEVEGIKSVHFYVPTDANVGHERSTHIAASLSGFSDGFRAFQKACA
jgi:hypothetical protein